MAASAVPLRSISLGRVRNEENPPPSVFVAPLNVKSPSPKLGPPLLLPPITLSLTVIHRLVDALTSSKSANNTPAVAPSGSAASSPSSAPTRVTGSQQTQTRTARAMKKMIFMEKGTSGEPGWIQRDAISLLDTNQ